MSKSKGHKMNIDNDFHGRKTYITINSKATTEITREADDSDEYDHDDTHTDHYISGLTFEDGKNNAFDLIYPDDLFCGSELFLVSCLYTEGDSFSTNSGNIDYIGVFKDREKAEECVKTIERHANENDGSYSLEVPVDDIHYMDISTPWNGYFESLDDVSIDLLKCVKDNDLNRVERIKMEKDLSSKKSNNKVCKI